MLVVELLALLKKDSNCKASISNREYSIFVHHHAACPLFVSQLAVLTASKQAIKETKEQTSSTTSNKHQSQHSNEE